ncbi:o-succinylbenzoate synthase [Pleomorphovibrio marinus]|uniref:o-succinylbenzoate synthase n=1 Tax=Pleomorphovibrio marinus TaxID=2164132 RepID=UPI000E0BDC50|nr:o-succinylbenzoate synthase [Pleomorphovibrio marinus]
MSSSFTCKAILKPYTLQFKFDAGTSRGVLKSKVTFLLQVRSTAFQNQFGYGEAGPLTGLSRDDLPDFEERAKKALQYVETLTLPKDPQKLLDVLGSEMDSSLPSLRFAMETALLDLVQGGNQVLFPSTFTSSKRAIPINGLVWMGEMQFMQDQIAQKLRDGYSCIKMKIGALDFDQECRLLEMVRKTHGAERVILRVDANGAFDSDTAMEKLKALSKFKIHSIEQPVQPGQWDLMGKLCRESPVHVALDEELINIAEVEGKKKLMDTLQPPYIILKPTLLGGLSSSREWIGMADSKGVGWWITSALESNIGLNAIAQFTATTGNTLHQGLGTGQLYHNNFRSPLSIANGELTFQRDKGWQDLKELF